MATGKKARSTTKHEEELNPARIRNHKFASFTQRVARLKIDPIRRNRNQELDGDDLQSHFRNGLSHWKESNLTESFSNFVKEVDQLCDSLPQVLHHRTKIVRILLRYLEERNALSLEPLLNLTSCLAHDLGATFEEYFPAVLALILDIAAKHKDIEAIEWSFSCLAWLFKYLSRLLVPDLRATYDLVAKALGKENHKPFIARFAAEALSFLLRKAASVYLKDPEPLDRIVKHIYADFDDFDLESKHHDVYQYGIMSLFTTTIKGVDTRFHTVAPSVFRCLLHNLSSQRSQDILIGVLTSSIHHGDANTMAPMMEVIYNYMDKLCSGSEDPDLETPLRFLFTLTVVRHGTRVKNWQAVFHQITKLVNASSTANPTTRGRLSSSIAQAAAVAFSNADSESCMANVRLLNSLSQRLSTESFVTLCVSLAEFSPERFSQFLLPLFLKCLTTLDEDKKNMVLLAGLQISDRVTWLDDNRPIPSSYQQQLIELFQSDTESSQELFLCAGHLELLPKLHLAENTRQSIGGLLIKRLQQSQSLQGLVGDDRRNFYLGSAMRFALKYALNTPTWEQLSQGLHAFSTVPIYLDNLRQFLDSSKSEIAQSAILEAVDEVVKNLSSPSKGLRQSSLSLLQALYKYSGSQESSILSTALELENLLLDAKSARTASMYVRRLAEQYQSIEEHSWLVKAIPAYCFGLLHFKLGQVRTESIQALKQISTNTIAETVITDMTFEWLDTAQLSQASSVQPVVDQKVRYNEFDCSNRNKVTKLLDRTQSDLDNAIQCLQDRFSKTHTSEPRVNLYCRGHALDVLKCLPELAEKRSRRLVPIFLRYSETSSLDISKDEEEPESPNDQDFAAAVPQDRLSRRDQLALLEIFGLFVNPRMLYRASDVHAELLRFLCSGDLGVQKAALKALSAWKSEALDRYAENLSNLLDETRFREEIATFLNEDQLGTEDIFAELLPYLLRLLYGRVISRVGSTSSKGSLTTKRRAVFDALARLRSTAIVNFAKIALGPLISLEYIGTRAVLPPDIDIRNLTQRHHLGLLNLMKDMVDCLGEKVVPALHSILPAILWCGQESSGPEHSGSSTTAKDIRKSALQCLASVSSRTSTETIFEFLPGIVEIYATPRLDSLATESSQSISALLQLLAVWAASPAKSLWLVNYDARIIDAVTQILTSPAVKDSVLLFIMEQIIKPIARFAISENLANATQIKQKVIDPNTGFILQRISRLLENSPERRILGSALSLVSALAGSVEDSIHIQSLLQLSVSLLAQPASRVSPRSKGDVLGFLVRFISLSGLTARDKLLDELEHSLIPLLLYFKDRDNRVQLTNVLLGVARLDPDLKQAADLCCDLDSFSTTSIDEPDFDRRLHAFREIGAQASTFSAKQWQPMVYSLLYHVQDTEELVIRTSASLGLKSFVKVAATSACSNRTETFQLLDNIVLPALRHGAAHRSELVRLEYLSIFAEVVKQFSSWDKVNDLGPLLVNDDEEASFFSNILHIQQHRRLRALRRLASEASKGQLQSNNIAHFLIPLLEHFVLDEPDDKTEHNIIFETITTLGRLALGLEWPQFRAMFRRYTTYVLTNPSLEKAAIRLLTMMTEALSQVTKTETIQNDEMDLDGDNSDTRSQAHRLSLTLPKGDKLSEDVAKNLTTPLRQYVHQKDETLVSQRVPVAVTVAKLIMLLSENQIAQQLPPLLTDVCQILRSRTQESRDLARKTLVDISKAVGSPYFGFILKELRAALPRGYQLHVLSFTTHMLLVHNEALFQNGELDYCLADIANIIMDDMFGVTGQEKDAEDYISQMREVKSNKSYDSMEIVSRISSLGKIQSLLQPIMALLEEKLDLRMLKKIDELLRRLGVGLLRNEAIKSQAALVLCFELLQQVYHKEQAVVAQPYQDHRRKRFLINMTSIKKSNIAHATSSSIHKLARFAFDLLRTILSRHDTLQTPGNILGFLPVIGEGIMSNHEEVQVSVIRLLAAIIRIPLTQLDKNAPVYISEAINLIKGAATTSSEASQAALKLITVLLRDRDDVTLKEADVSYILKRISTDLDEPDRQGITFNFLKAVLYRKVVVAEIYEIMDAVAAMMIRNQSVSARNAARGVYVQFLVNYPQGKDRLKKQWAFLIKNLDYEFEIGRQSVMETLHLLLGKVGHQTAQDVVNNFFAPLVLATINDESSDCRKMSALLLKEFFEQASEDTMGKMLVLLRSWLVQEDQTLLIRVALQTFTLYIEAEPTKAERSLPLLISRIEGILKRMNPENVADEWDIVYSSLQLLLKAAVTYPTTLFKQDTADLWKLVIESSHYPHAWVKSASSKILGLYFADFARSQAEQETLSLPVIGSGGLCLDMNTMMSVTRSSLNSLKLVGISEELATQLVKNTVFFGRLFSAVSSTKVPVQSNTHHNGNEEETGSEDDEDETTGTVYDPLAFIFARISFILRRETVSARAASMIPKTASIRLLAALCSHLPAETLSANSNSILMPLHVITDPSTTVPFSTDAGFKSAHADLISDAQELMTMLPTKLGTAEFIHALSQVRDRIKQKRDERKVKRRIEAVTEPERTGHKRTKKRTQQREKRKEKNAGYRAQRRGW